MMTQAQTGQIDVKEAVRAAREYLLNIYDGQPLRELMLEEVELSEDEAFWNITFGFDTDRPAAPNTLFPNLAAPKFVRDYKIIKVNAADGSVNSMKIRELK